jgi:phosphoribosyl 1,2-cyclic phosphodiesterase
MLARVWGCRGTIAAPGPSTVGYGGNTSCVEVRTLDGSVVILDAGTGARALGTALHEEGVTRIHLLLTHLHLDHLEGLGTFQPIWRPETELHVWGPASPMHSLRRRIATYFSPPLFPVHLATVPARVTFHDAPEGDWTIGSARISSRSIMHPGPTVGYRIEDGGRSIAYLTDHEPAFASDLLGVGTEWISGFGLARDADVLIHDCQYTEQEYAVRVGFGHSSTEHVATFARLCDAGRVLLYHHDPMHADPELERIRDRVRELWTEGADRVDLAAEGMVLRV